jgi:type I restriction enzyme S subunit
MSSQMKIERLNNIIDFKNGKIAPKEIGNIPIYGGNGILGYTNKSNYENIMIIGRVGAYCGSVHIEKGKCWVSDNAIAGIHKNLDSNYYNYYLLKSLDLNKYQIGSSQPLLTQGILNLIEIKIHKNFKNQIEIGDLVSKLDSKIELNNCINTELEAMTKTLYDYWFVQFDFPNANGKPYKTSGGKMVWNAELKRDIPEGWEVKLIGDVAEVKAGGDKPKDYSINKSENYNTNLFKWYNKRRIVWIYQTS